MKKENQTSTTSTTTNPHKLDSTFFAARWTATEPPMLYNNDISASIIIVKRVKNGTIRI